MNFKSDNVAGVSSEILTAIMYANQSTADSYGTDSYSQKLQKRVAEIFEHDVTIFLTMTGTASNALALSSLVPGYGTVYCQSAAHINVDECGAPEFFANGIKLIACDGKQSKIDLDAIERHILHVQAERPHASKPVAISITQATEGGTVYSLTELAAVKTLVDKYALGFHMDGARFTNALVTLGCTPAQMTWKMGVDVLSFGATKNGAMLAEMVVFFNKKYAEDFDYRHKRAGQLASKTRFLAVQFLSYFEHDLWIKNARHANNMAQKLVKILQKVPQMNIKYHVESNEIFVNLPLDFVNFVREAGVQFYNWGEHSYRFVTSFSTQQEDLNKVDFLIEKFKSSFPEK